MPKFLARVVGDDYFDDVNADTMLDAAKLFATKISVEDAALENDGDTALIEIGDGQWVNSKRFEATACVTKKIDIIPL